MNTRALLKAVVVRTPPKPPQAPAPVVETLQTPPVVEALLLVEAVVETHVETEVATSVETEVVTEVVTEIAAPVQEALSPEATLLAKTQSSVTAELSTGSWDSLLDEIWAHESANKNRKRVLAAVEAQKAAAKA